MCKNITNSINDNWNLELLYNTSAKETLWVHILWLSLSTRKSIFSRTPQLAGASLCIINMFTRKIVQKLSMQSCISRQFLSLHNKMSVFFIVGTVPIYLHVYFGIIKRPYTISRKTLTLN